MAKRKKEEKEILLLIDTSLALYKKATHLLKSELLFAYLYNVQILGPTTT